MVPGCDCTPRGEGRVSTAALTLLCPGVAGPSVPAEPPISCSITGSATSCDSGGQTVLIPPSSVIGLSAEVTGVDAQSTEVVFGFRAVTP
jgi:hypothetical protein